jgi:hypothetical protein
MRRVPYILRMERMFVPIESALRVAAYFAIAMVLGMLAIYLATGVGQDPLQFVHSPEEYGALLLRAPATLRACIGLDNLFIAFYETTFVALAVVVRRAGANVTVVGVALGALLLLGALDLVENCHFLTMLARAETGALPSAAEIDFQVLESLVKFHVGYVALFVLALALPRTSRAARALANLSWLVQLPVGVLIYVTPHAISVPLVFVRFAYFVIALALAAAAFGRRGGSIGSSAPVSHPGTTPAVAG